MIKRCVSLFIVFFLLVSLASVGMVVAQEGGDEDPGVDNFETDEREENLFCVSCGDSCVTAEFASAALCNPPSGGEPICGAEDGECVFGF